VLSTKDDKSAGDGSPFDRFKQLVAEGSLYAPVVFSEKDILFVATVIGAAGLQLDLDCPSCEASSTFLLPPVTISGAPAQFQRPIGTVPEFEQTVKALQLRCARNATHTAEFILRMRQDVEWIDGPPNRVEGGGPSAGPMSRPQPHPRTNYTLVKIGQFPPHAELVAGHLKAASKIADRLDMNELRRAAGLVSHDAAIGAFVYLRRVFERIIARAWKSAKESGESLPDPPPLRMEQKIEALKNHLPDIVGRNAKVYGILSLGLHELTEEQCARAYPLVEESVIAMLEDAHMHAEKRKREKRISDELARMSGELGKSS
jgi:hypothetical protein